MPDAGAAGTPDCDEHCIGGLSGGGGWLNKNYISWSQMTDSALRLASVHVTFDELLPVGFDELVQLDFDK